MSEENLPPRAAGKKRPSEGEPLRPPGPSLGRRIISWVFILLLLLVVLFEWNARRHYTASLNAVKSNYKAEQDANRDITLAQAEAHLTGGYRKSALTVGGDPVTEYRWPSLFRTYVIYMRTEKGTDAVMDLQTEPIE